MQPRCRQRHNLISRGLIYQPIFAEQALGGEQAAQLLQVFHGRCYLDLRQGGLAVASLDQGGHFGGPYALAIHGVFDSLFLNMGNILAHGVCPYCANSYQNDSEL